MTGLIILADALRGLCTQVNPVTHMNTSMYFCIFPIAWPLQEAFLSRFLHRDLFNDKVHFTDQLKPFEDLWKHNISKHFTTLPLYHCLLIYLNSVLFAWLCQPQSQWYMCIVINGEYRTGSKVDSLWVPASVADGSAPPQKIGHLGASWRTSGPCCATATQVVARSHSTTS